MIPRYAPADMAASTAGPDESLDGELEALSVRLARRGAISVAAAAARRAAALSVDSARRLTRLLRAAELAFEMGESDLLQRLVLEVEQLNPDGEQRARLTWLRNTFVDNVPGDPSQMESLIDAAEVAATAGNNDVALHLLFGAGLRCWRSDLGERARDRVAGAVERLLVPATDPRRVVILAIAGPVRWGPVVAERLAAIEGKGELAGEAAYLAGAARADAHANRRSGSRSAALAASHALRP